MWAAAVEKRYFLCCRSESKKNIIGLGGANDVITILKNKYPKGEPANMQVCFPTTWEKKKRSDVNKLMLESKNSTDKNWQSLLFKSLLLLL